MATCLGSKNRRTEVTYQDSESKGLTIDQRKQMKHCRSFKWLTLFVFIQTVEQLSLHVLPDELCAVDFGASSESSVKRQRQEKDIVSSQKSVFPIT